MPNVGQVLKAEIARLAKKEAKAFAGPVAGTIKCLKRTLSAQRKKIAELERQVEKLGKKLGCGGSIAIPSADKLEKSRLGVKGIGKLRAKLGLSRADMAKLLGVNANSIFLWENGKSKPRAAARAKLIALRGMGKRQIKKALKELEAAAPAPAKA